MCDLKRTLDAGGHCVLEMPSGTGKTVSLLSLIVAYQQYYPEHRKLIYCSRTMSEIEKALAELKALMKYRTDQLGKEEDFRGLGLTSRKNLCLHPSVKREKSGAVVDARCRSLTAGFVKEQKERGEDVDVCVYHDNLDLLEPHSLVPPGVFTLDGMLKYGEKHKQCPYFSARRMVGSSSRLHNDFMLLKKADVVLQRDYLFVPLSFRSQNCRTSQQRTIEGLYSRF